MAEALPIVNPNQALVTPGGTSTTTSPNSGAMVEQIQQKLLGQSDIISSENTNLENKINEAITTVKTGEKASEGAITSAYDRKITDTLQAGQQQFNAAQNAQRGFAVNTAALKQLDESTDKSVKDLEQRKQELILQGQAAAATTVSDLQVKAIQFRQQAQQQVFTNLLGMASFAQQQQQILTQNSQFERQQGFTEDKAVADITQKYGVAPKTGETFEQFSARAVKEMGANSPAALDIQQAKQQILASQAAIRASDASAAVSRAQAQGAAALSALDLDTLGAAYNAGALDLSLLKGGATQMAAVIGAANNQNKTAVNAQIDSWFSSNTSKTAAMQLINTSTGVTDKAAALTYLQQKYGTSEVPNGGVKTQRSLTGDATKVGDVVLKANEAISNYIFGKSASDTGFSFIRI